MYSDWQVISCSTRLVYYSLLAVHSIYILRNYSDVQSIYILRNYSDVLFFASDGVATLVSYTGQPLYRASLNYTGEFSQSNKAVSSEISLSFQ